MLLDDFYKIIDLKSTEKHSLEVKVAIDKKHHIFNGHFPKNPVTPGVIMLQIIKNCLETKLNTSLLIQKTSNVKFLAMVNPKIDTILIFKIDIQNENKIFKIKNHTSFSDGRSVLKCNATFVEYLN